MKTLIIEAHSGKIRYKNTVETPIEEALKEEATKLIKNDWIPFFSDFMIIRDTVDVELTLPLKKEEYSLYKEYNLRKTGEKTATASIPVFFIVYESLKIGEDKYHDRGVAVVAPYTRKEDESLLEEILEETTRKPSPEEIEETIPEELLEEETQKKTRGRKKKKRK